MKSDDDVYPRYLKIIKGTGSHVSQGHSGAPDVTVGCEACGMGPPDGQKLFRHVAEVRRSSEGAGSGWLTCRRGAVINFGNLAL